MIQEDIETGIVIAGLPKGVMKDHLLLRSESISNYDAFRAEYENIARAKFVRPTPMELDEFDDRYTLEQWEAWAQAGYPEDEGAEGVGAFGKNNH